MTTQGSYPEDDELLAKQVAKQARQLLHTADELRNESRRTIIESRAWIAESLQLLRKVSPLLFIPEEIAVQEPLPSDCVGHCCSRKLYRVPPFDAYGEQISAQRAAHSRLCGFA